MPAGAPRSPIAIRQLYLDGVYDGQVVPWLRLAERAMQALRAGEAPPPVPAVTIRQDQMPKWARGVVWDTSDPADCFPVRRSSPVTWEEDFPGDKIDPAAFKRAAERVGWDDFPGYVQPAWR